MQPLRVLVVEDNPADIDLLLKTYALGANCYITKPSTLQGLRHVVRQLDGFWFNLVKLPMPSHTSP